MFHTGNDIFVRNNHTLFIYRIRLLYNFFIIVIRYIRDQPFLHFTHGQSLCINERNDCTIIFTRKGIKTNCHSNAHYETYYIFHILIVKNNFTYYSMFNIYIKIQIAY